MSRVLLLAAMLLLVCTPLACSGTSTAHTATVKTLGAFEIYGDGATLKGELVNLGGSTKAEVWFRVKAPSGWDETTKQTLTAPGEFSYRLTNLDQQFTYTFEAWAKGDNSRDEGHGDPVDFNIADIIG